MMSLVPPDFLVCNACTAGKNRAQPGCSDPTDVGQLRARGRRARHPDLHLWHHRHAPSARCRSFGSSAWTLDNDAVTPTFKVKHNRITEDLGAKHCEAWEASGKKAIWRGS